MKPTELMIDDWVFNKHHKKYIQITPYDFFNHAHLPSGEKYFVGEPKVISGRDFEPIPLTSEILKKNGFELRDGFFYHRIDDKPHHYDFKLENGGVFTSEGYTLQCGIYHLTIRYVHELQHTLRLCGLNELADNFKVEE